MGRPKPERSYSVSTEAVRSKNPFYAGAVHPDSAWIVWSPDSETGVREYRSFHRARTVAQSLSGKHPDRTYRVFKSCWGRKPKADPATFVEVVTTADLLGTDRP